MGKGERWNRLFFRKKWRNIARPPEFGKPKEYPDEVMVVKEEKVGLYGYLNLMKSERFS